MKDVNKIILIGRLGSHPIIRHTKNGTTVAQLSVATSRRIYKNDSQSLTGSPHPESGERLPSSDSSPYAEETQWHRVVVWSRQGEACAKYLKKGDKIYVEGYVRTRSYQDKEGQTRYTFEIHAEDISFLSDRPSGGVSMVALESHGNSFVPNPEPDIPEIQI